MIPNYPKWTFSLDTRVEGDTRVPIVSVIDDGIL